MHQLEKVESYLEPDRKPSSDRTERFHKLYLDKESPRQRALKSAKRRERFHQSYLEKESPRLEDTLEAYESQTNSLYDQIYNQAQEFGAIGTTLSSSATNAVEVACDGAKKADRELADVNSRNFAVSAFWPGTIFTCGGLASYAASNPQEAKAKIFFGGGVLALGAIAHVIANYDGIYDELE